jgi:hypothetical protein
MWFEPMFAIHDYQHQLEGDDRSYGAGLAFRDPDNIQLEFFLPMGS